MLSFRQKIFTYYVIVFLIFIIVMFPIISQWVKHLVLQTMETGATELIAHIEDSPNDEALIRRLDSQKGSVIFRYSIINNEQKVLYDTHVKRLLRSRFNPDYVVDHPEVKAAFKEGIGYHEAYSKLLNQDFAYFAKSFDFHGKTYVLRTAFPLDYISKLVRDFEIGFLAFSIASLLLFSFMTWFIINYLTKPIQLIIDRVKPYQEGFQTTLPAIDTGNLNPHGDFAKLARTMNSLSAKVQTHIDYLTNERNEKEAILESLVEGVIAIDEHFVISYINNMAYKLFGIDKNVIGENFNAIGQNKSAVLLQRCQSEEIPLIDTQELVREGKKLYLDIIAAPKRGNGGAILVIQDKTAHYKITEMRRDFIANASHELKTPITIIRGFAEALHENPDLPREVQETVTAKIMKNCTRMTGLIKDLLTLADIENIPISRLVNCDLFALAQECRSMVLEVFPEAQITIDKSPEDQEFKLIADRQLLELAITNLIENAAKYSNKPAKIQVLLEDKPGVVKIVIADKGIGIPEADLEHIFDRFYTVDKAHSQKMGGSGLGLSIVKTIIEKHFGTISVASKLGEGTSFYIELPKRDIPIELE